MSICPLCWVVVGVHPCPGHLSPLLCACPSPRHPSISWTPVPSPGSPSPLPSLSRAPVPSPGRPSISQASIHLPGARPLSRVVLGTCPPPGSLGRPSPLPPTGVPAPGSPWPLSGHPHWPQLSPLVWAPHAAPSTTARGPQRANAPGPGVGARVCWPQTLGCPAPRTMLLGGFMPGGCLYVRTGQGWGQWRAPGPWAQPVHPGPGCLQGLINSPGFAGRVHGYGRGRGHRKGETRNDELKPQGRKSRCGRRHGGRRKGGRNGAQRLSQEGRGLCPPRVGRCPLLPRAGRPGPEQSLSETRSREKQEHPTPPSTAHLTAQELLSLQPRGKGSFSPSPYSAVSSSRRDLHSARRTVVGVHLLSC